MIPESYVVYDGELKKLGRRWNTWVSRYYILRSDGEFTCRRKKTVIFETYFPIYKKIIGSCTQEDTQCKWLYI